MKVCILGGGYSALAAAWSLVKKGIQVEILEKSKEAGGLVGAFPFEGNFLDCYYRHIFVTDEEARRVSEEMGCEVKWHDSRMAYYTHGKIYPFGTPLELLKFKPLSFSSRIQTGLATLAIRFKHKTYENLENKTAVDFIIETFGKESFETLWKPLLLAKFAEKYQEVSAVWFWGKIALRARSRNSSGHKEQLGYMHGSYAKLTQKMVLKLQELGVTFHQDCSLERVEKKGNGFLIVAENKTFECDRVLSALPLPVFLKVADGLLSSKEKQNWSQIDFTAVRVTVLKLSKPYSHYYWMNIGDREIPFGGLIEHTNLVSSEEYGGKSILYISHYMFKDNEWYQKSHEKSVKDYIPYLKKINPSFDEKDILETYETKNLYAQPVIPLNYSSLKPEYKTSVEGLFHVGMAHIYPEDRGMNYALLTGRLCAEEMSQTLS